MHGRLKIKSSAQQEAEKAAERKIKLAGYRQVMSEVLRLRDEGCKNEKQLHMTGQLLLSNPDIHTLWNIRREIILHLCQESEDDLLLKKEVEMTQGCLMTNPKSYGAWHQRIWCLDKMSSPDWDRELQLTEKFLQMDERNFHCWDYRQTLARKSGQKSTDELQFTMDRINSNFSNYSAWHYRSKLLPTDEETVHHQELDLVQNAAFTDPEDSSAWLYHSWLVGGHNMTQLTPKPLYLLTDGDKVILATNRPIKKTDIESNRVLDWMAGARSKLSCLWTSALTPGTGLTVSLSFGDSKETLQLEPGTQNRRHVLGSGRLQGFKFQPVPNDTTKKVLEEEMDNCQQLLELEPDSKWTNFTKVMLMRALDTNRYFNDIMTTLEQLTSIDTLRKNYYDDLKSQIFVENALENSTDFKCLDLTAMKLSKIYHKQYMNIFEEVKYNE